MQVAVRRAVQRIGREGLTPSLRVTVPAAVPSHFTYATMRLPGVTPVSCTASVVPLASLETPWLCPNVRGCGGVALTVRRKLVDAVANPSLTVTVIVAVPVWPATGVTVTVRALPEPPKTMLATGTSVGFVVPPVSVRFPAGVSTSPTVTGIGPTATPGLVV